MAKDRLFHTECFSCSVCSKTLAGMGFTLTPLLVHLTLLRNENLCGVNSCCNHALTEQDNRTSRRTISSSVRMIIIANSSTIPFGCAYSSQSCEVLSMTSPVHSPPCAACNDVIKGRYITALNQAWHPEHFVCTECNQPFQGDQVCVCVFMCIRVCSWSVIFFFGCFDCPRDSSANTTTSRTVMSTSTKCLVPHAPNAAKTLKVRRLFRAKTAYRELNSSLVL